MSCDAKIWQDDKGEWHGLHDGGCVFPSNSHHDSSYGLTALLVEIEACMRAKHGMRWELHVYPDGKAGLRGWH